MKLCKHEQLLRSCEMCELERENADLKAELSESARLHAMGSEREARLMARVVELERESLRGLEAGEPTNREKIYGPLLDKLKPKAGEPVAYVWDEAAYPEGDIRGRGWREVMGRHHPNNPAMTRQLEPLYLDDVMGRCAELDAANVGLAQESHDLQQICRNAYEVWAGSNGIPAPQTAAEAYLLSLLEQMRDEVKRGLK